jgi:multiple sugar transport system substrate-binding protein
MRSKPIQAQKMRTVVSKNFSQEVDYVTEEPQQFSFRVKEEQQGGTHSIDLVGALHGELQPLVQLDALAPSEMIFIL